MNKKGFTLIELIGTITILAIIMAIAIPNVISITRKNKNQTYINDARKMVTLAKYKFESDAEIPRPNSSRCVIIQFQYLDQSELQKGPENGEYDGINSYVKIEYENSKYIYSAQLIEKYGDDGENKKGVKLTSYEDLVKLDAKNKITTTETEFTPIASSCYTYEGE